MALKGLDIYKHLPKTNCKKCGLPTCLAFAMKVAAKQAALDECPELTDEAKDALGAASAPPQKLVKIGVGDKAVELGQETVMFRHEEKFHHETAVAVYVEESEVAADADAVIKKVKSLEFERVGEHISIDLVALKSTSGDAAAYADAAGKISEGCGLAMVLVGDDAEVLGAAANGPLSGKRPLLCGANKTNAEAMAALAKEAQCPLCVTDADMESLSEVTQKVVEAGAEDLFISPGQVDLTKALEFNTLTRRAALKKVFRPLGFPLASWAVGEDKYQTLLDACAQVSKYGGVLITNATEPWQMLAILSTRMNIYTDPQKPVQVEAKVHDILDPDDNAPFLITTNFSLSFYSVAGEVEAARVPCRILAVDTEGTSVLTAWAADKFNAETIAKAIKDSDIEGRIGHKTAVIPGLVAVLSGALEEECGWRIMVGPKEATRVGSYLKNDWKPN